MHPMVNIAVRAARGAGNIIARHMDRLDRVTVEIKADNDFVTEVDRMAEREIVAVLRKAYPDHAVRGEEFGDSGDSDYVWIIDPLDGTTNFLHGFPTFSVSIALRHRGVLEVGVIYDPVRQELFTAKRGAGAMLDGRRLRMTPRRSLQAALIGTGFPFKCPEHLDAYVGMFRAVLERAGDVRRTGSAALDLAYVAANRLDGFWEIGLEEWDIAAGTLLIQEAGGQISDLGGGDRHHDTGNVAAGSPKLFRDLLQTLHPHLTPALR